MFTIVIIILLFWKTVQGVLELKYGIQIEFVFSKGRFWFVMLR